MLSPSLTKRNCQRKEHNKLQITPAASVVVNNFNQIYKAFILICGQHLNWFVGGERGQLAMLYNGVQTTSGLVTKVSELPKVIFLKVTAAVQ